MPGDFWTRGSLNNLCCEAMDDGRCSSCTHDATSPSFVHSDTSSLCGAERDIDLRNKVDVVTQPLPIDTVCVYSFELGRPLDIGWALNDAGVTFEVQDGTSS